MGNRAKPRTEHAGAKNGGAAYWGKRADAKRESAKARRQADRRESVAPCPLPHVPNAKTRAAMREAERGGLPRAKDIASLLSELNAPAPTKRNPPKKTRRVDR